MKRIISIGWVAVVLLAGLFFAFFSLTREGEATWWTAAGVGFYLVATIATGVGIDALLPSDKK